MKRIIKKFGWVWKPLALIAIILGSYFLINWFLGSRAYVPKEFLEARLRAAKFADTIIRLSNESIRTLRLISDYDSANNYTEGLALIKEELSRNGVARDSALRLSKELIVMTNNLQTVKPDNSSKLGLEAILTESQIAQHLISYNNLIYDLVELLRIKFINPARADNQKIRSTIFAMNQEAGAVNNLNTQYKELMAQFDELTGLGE